MASRMVALLRAINVGKAKRIAMAELRVVVEGLGYREVKTLLNSGNVVFTAPDAVGNGDWLRAYPAGACPHSPTRPVPVPIPRRNASGPRKRARASPRFRGPDENETGLSDGPVRIERGGDAAYHRRAGPISEIMSEITPEFPEPAFPSLPFRWNPQYFAMADES